MGLPLAEVPICRLELNVCEEVAAVAAVAAVPEWEVVRRRLGREALRKSWMVWESACTRVLLSLEITLRSAGRVVTV